MGQLLASVEALWVYFVPVKRRLLLILKKDTISSSRVYSLEYRKTVIDSLRCVPIRKSRRGKIDDFGELGEIENA